MKMESLQRRRVLASDVLYDARDMEARERAPGAALIADPRAGRAEGARDAPSPRRAWASMIETPRGAGGARTDHDARRAMATAERPYADSPGR